VFVNLWGICCAGLQSGCPPHCGKKHDLGRTELALRPLFTVAFPRNNRGVTVPVAFTVMSMEWWRPVTTCDSPFLRITFSRLSPPADGR
jgi:hypothetical protein